MKLPRNVSGKELLRRLEGFGYEPTRQSGSHVRATTLEKGQHHGTVPMHDELRVGTLNSIITDIAAHFGLDKAEVSQKLFR
jgi:predicted RNA binding protein YcfA (HicA-like mRNA interferase family)